MKRRKPRTVARAPHRGRSRRVVTIDRLRDRLLHALQAYDRWCHPGLSRGVVDLITLAEQRDDLEPWERTYRVRLILTEACAPHTPDEPPLIKDEAFDSLVARAAAKVEQMRRILARRNVSHAALGDDWNTLVWLG
ncbi:MAG: hypothetical protein GC159_19710 [Phycisphaera sp.]|nr:hypothetical protein [Phycisphaera sp.]